MLADDEEEIFLELDGDHERSVDDIQDAGRRRGLDVYAMLGLPPTATHEEVKQAYKRLSGKYSKLRPSSAQRNRPSSADAQRQRQRQRERADLAPAPLAGERAEFVPPSAHVPTARPPSAPQPATKRPPAPHTPSPALPPTYTPLSIKKDAAASEVLAELLGRGGGDGWGAGGRGGGGGERERPMSEMSMVSNFTVTSGVSVNSTAAVAAAMRTEDLDLENAVLRAKMEGRLRGDVTSLIHRHRQLEAEEEDVASTRSVTSHLTSVAPTPADAMFACEWEQFPIKLLKKVAPQGFFFMIFFGNKIPFFCNTFLLSFSRRSRCQVCVCVCLCVCVWCVCLCTHTHTHTHTCTHAGWKPFKSSSTGKIYWHHKEHKDTRWDPPDGHPYIYQYIYISYLHTHTHTHTYTHTHTHRSPDVRGIDGLAFRLWGQQVPKP